MKNGKKRFFTGLFIRKSWVRLDLGIYWFWAFLRVLLTILPQTGYIHPDEYFQTAEVAAGDVFNLQVSLPWEFNATFPIRSIPLIYATLHLPLSAVKWISQFLELYTGMSMCTPYVLILTERIAMCLLSFISDYCLFRICYLYGQNYKERLIIFGSSFVSLVYLTRTFTNTLEVACFNILLFFVASCMAESEKINYQNGYLKDKFKDAETIADRVKIKKLIKLLPNHSLRRCLRIAFVTVAGFFNRPTFLLYAVGPLFYWFQRGLSTQSTFRKDFHVRVFVFLIYCLPVTGLFIFCDSVYYGYLTWGEVLAYRVNFRNFVLTPLNFLWYNLDTTNLSKHGLHPRFLHVLINIPLLFNILGICGLVVVFKMVYRGSLSYWTLLPKSQSITGMMTLSFLCPIIGLSLFPHQEPRFIVPALLPLVFLYSHLLVDFEEECTAVAPFRKRYPTRRPIKGMFKLPLKCLNYIEDTMERFDNRFNIDGRYLSTLKQDIVSVGEDSQGLPRRTAPKSKMHQQETEEVTKPQGQSYLVKIWYFLNVVCLVFFGFLHQGGVYSLCKHMHGELLFKQRYTTLHLVTSHTYSLPLHLLNIKYQYGPSNIHFQSHELGSQNFENIHLKLVTILKELEAKKLARRKNYKIFYALPASIFHEYEYSHHFYSVNYTYTLEKYFYPHFTTEALPTLMLNVTAHGINFQSESLFLEVINSFPVKYLCDFLSQFGLILVSVKLKT